MRVFARLGCDPVTNVDDCAQRDRLGGTHLALPRLAPMIDEVSRGYSRRAADYIERWG